MDTQRLQQIADRTRELANRQHPHIGADDAFDAPADWFSLVVNQDDDETSAEVRIYDAIGGMFGVGAQDFADQLSGLDVDRIDLRINSPGGAVFDGIAIYNSLHHHKAHVDVTVDGVAASAASFIAQAGDTITMGRQAMMMIHDANGVTIGNSQDHREMADLLDKLSAAIADIYAERSRVPAEFWRHAMNDETWYSADEAVAAGLADKVTPKKGDDESEDESVFVAAGFDLSVFNYAGRDAAPAPKMPPAKLTAAAAYLPDDAAHLTNGGSGKATDDTSWDASAAVAKMEGAAELRYCHAYKDPDGDPEDKSSYKFPHHRRQGGPANLPAVRNGLARLSQAHISDDAKKRVESHLRSHMPSDDADDAAATTPTADASSTLPATQPTAAAALRRVFDEPARVPDDTGDNFKAAIANAITAAPERVATTRNTSRFPENRPPAPDWHRTIREAVL